MFIYALCSLKFFYKMNTFTTVSTVLAQLNFGYCARTRASTKHSQLGCTYGPMVTFLGSKRLIMTSLLSLFILHSHSTFLVHAGNDHMTASQGACVGVAGSLSGSV